MDKALDDLKPGGPLHKRLKVLLAKKKDSKLTVADKAELAAINGMLMGVNALDIGERHETDPVKRMEKARKIRGGE